MYVNIYMDADLTTREIQDIEDWYDLRAKLKKAQTRHTNKDFREFNLLLDSVDNILKLASEHKRKYLRNPSQSLLRNYTEKIAEANTIVQILQEHLFLTLLQKPAK